LKETNPLLDSLGKMRRELYKIINKWHEDTINGIESKIGPDMPNADEIDKLCFCVAKTSYQYCSAIIQLLDRGYEFPARALMRCIGELSAKFTWSLVDCSNKKNNNSGAIKERLQRWRWSACSEGIKLLEKSTSVKRPEDEDVHERILNDLKKQREGLHVNEGIPKTAQIFEQLGKEYEVYKKIHIAFYSVFNNAVHIDPASMSKIYLSQEQGQDSTRSYCFAIAYHINSLIRSKYNLDIQQITDEFNEITFRMDSRFRGNDIEENK